jgi:uncharacterized protein YggT (Ycf19 family)
MSLSISMKVAIAEAVARALAAAPADGPCEACGGEPAVPYAFAYARLVRPGDPSLGSKIATQVYTDSIGAHVVRLCEPCIAPARKRLVAKRRKITIGFGLAWLVVAVILYLVRGWDIALVVLGTGVLLTALVYGQQWRTAHDIRVAGQARALELHETELRGQGYDVFWSDPQEVRDSILGLPSTH